MSSTKKVWDSPKRKHWVPGSEGDIFVPDGDAGRGEKIYKAACAGCHILDSDEWLGPNLTHIYNRPAIKSKKFNYTDNCNKIQGKYWTRSLLWVFLENPESLIPETSMTYDGMADAWDRACVIEYLHALRVLHAR